jgi:hypothetical protein
MQNCFYYKGKPYKFNEILVNYTQARERSAVIIAQEGVNFFKDSFRNQGFTNNTLIPWRRTKHKQNQFGKKSQGILIRSGRLMRSIFASERTIKRITISVPTPYAQVNNEGFQGTVTVREHTRHVYTSKRIKYKTSKGNQRSKTVKMANGSHTVRSHTRTMNIPRRQFIGDSAVLNKQIDQILTKAIDKIF